MAKKRPVGVGPFEKKKDAGLPKHPLAQCGTIAPTDAKTEKLGSKFPASRKRTQKRQAK